MEFPVYSLVPAEVPSSTLRALGLDEIVHCAQCKEVRILMLVIESENQLAQLAPDYAALIQSTYDYDGVLVTARSHNGKYDFVYRYFWPWKGTNEDPVTGGAQTFLAKYWSEQLHKKKMHAFQSSQRTGDLEVELIDNDTRVLIKGDAVIVFEGEMRIVDC
jgi:PhzF family phenazine biosynthesis protein